MHRVRFYPCSWQRRSILTYSKERLLYHDWTYISLERGSKTRFLIGLNLLSLAHLLSIQMVHRVSSDYHLNLTKPGRKQFLLRRYKLFRYYLNPLFRVTLIEEPFVLDRRTNVLSEIRIQ